MSAGLRNQFSQFGGMGAGSQYPDPFNDVASLSVPTNMRSALYWCEYVFSMFGTYRMAMERVISYFLTDTEILDASDDETEKWDAFLNDTLDVKTIVQNNLRNRECFHGDTKAVTKNGVFTLRELSGRKVHVLSKDGVYRLAHFKSFGRQRLLEVTFSDGQKVLATPGHQWHIRNCSRKETIVTTDKLLRGHGIRRTVAPRPEKNKEYEEGIRHGFTYGDGSCYNDGRQAAAYFHGPKDAAMLAYFAGHVCEPIPKETDTDWTEGPVSVIHGLPAEYKQLPDNRRSASYWYGFVCGFLAADGSVDERDACVVLTQKAKATLEAIRDQLPRIGMSSGRVRSHWRRSTLTRRDGTVHEYAGFMSYLTILKRFVQADDLLLTKHRENFESKKKDTKYGEWIGVRSVHETNVTDEVYCCVEPETHTFVLGGGILTGNCYGNSFSSVVRPFVRFLVCPKCGYLAPLKEIHSNKAFGFKYNPGDPDKAFCAKCPACKVGSGYSGAWKIKDEDDDNEKKLKIKVWNPHEIEILHDTFSEEVAYLWRIPEDYKKQIRSSQDGRGNLFMLERAPKEVLKAIANNQIYRFHPDAVFHMKEPTLAGIYNRGWGLPRIISNFRQIWYVQVLRRFNEAIALDYVIPFRIITPAPTGGKTGGGLPMDPMTMYNGSDFRGQVMNMIRKRRRDPASLQVLPFPVNFQMFGADANQLAPRDLMDQGMETLLNDIGTPVELYNGSLQLQTAPVALRLFESTWHHLVHDANSFLGWLVRQISQIMSWETVTCKLKRVTIADNLEKQMMAAQLMMSQQLSGSTVLGDFGYNWKKEQRNIADESRYQSELQTRTQEEMEQAGFAQQIAKGQGGGDPSQQQGGGGGGGGQAGPAQAGAGGMQPGGGQSPVTAYLSQMSPNVPQTPEDMMQVADSLADELMGLPDSVKRSEMRKLQQYNQALSSMVKARMDQKRRDTKAQAGNQAVGQMQQQGGGGGGGAPPSQ